MNLLFLDIVNVYVSAHVCVSGLSLQHSTHSQKTLNLELVRITHALTHTHGGKVIASVSSGLYVCQHFS